jgi:hypothetical protein
MPRTQINYTEPSKTGTTLPSPTAADVSNGQYITNDGHVLVIAKNTGATSRNVTVTPTGTVDGQSAQARVTPIAAGVSLLMGPWEVANYSNQLQISGDNATDVSFLAIHYIA